MWAAWPLEHLPTCESEESSESENGKMEKEIIKNAFIA